MRGREHQALEQSLKSCPGFVLCVSFQQSDERGLHSHESGGADTLPSPAFPSRVLTAAGYVAVTRSLLNGTSGLDTGHWHVHTHRDPTRLWPDWHRGPKTHSDSRNANTGNTVCLRANEGREDGQIN